MAKSHVTAVDIERGSRLKALRKRLGLTQAQVYPGQHFQVASAESGRNKLGGGTLLIQVAKGLGLSVERLKAYIDGEATIDETVAVAVPGVAPPLGEAATALTVNDSAAPRLGSLRKVRAYLLGRGYAEQEVDAVIVESDYYDSPVRSLDELDAFDKLERRLADLRAARNQPRPVPLSHIPRRYVERSDAERGREVIETLKPPPEAKPDRARDKRRGARAVGHKR